MILILVGIRIVHVRATQIPTPSCVISCLVDQHASAVRSLAFHPAPGVLLIGWNSSDSLWAVCPAQELLVLRAPLLSLEPVDEALEAQVVLPMEEVASWFDLYELAHHGLVWDIRQYYVLWIVF